MSKPCEAVTTRPVPSGSGSSSAANSAPATSAAAAHAVPRTSARPVPRESAPTAAASDSQVAGPRPQLVDLGADGSIGGDRHERRLAAVDPALDRGESHRALPLHGLERHLELAPGERAASRSLDPGGVRRGVDGLGQRCPDQGGAVGAARHVAGRQPDQQRRVEEQDRGPLEALERLAAQPRNLRPADGRRFGSDFRGAHRFSVAAASAHASRPRMRPTRRRVVERLRRSSR